MLMNICFKFWMADELLKADIKLLMDITSKVVDNKHVIEFDHNLNQVLNGQSLELENQQKKDIEKMQEIQLD